MGFNIINKKNIAPFVLLRGDNSVSQKSRIHSFCRLQDCIIDDYSYVGSFSSLNNTRIGKFCSISRFVQIGLGTHPYEFLTTSPVFFTKTNGLRTSFLDSDGDERLYDSKPSKTTIGADVWIGSNVIITGGNEISPGSIIAAGSVVTKDVPPYKIYGGVPAKEIKSRFEKETIEVLLNLKWWNWPKEILLKHRILFQSKLDDSKITKLREISDDR